MIFKVTALVAVGVMSGAVGLWVADRELPVVRVAPPQVIGDVSPGGILRIRFSINRLRDCSVKASRFIYDSQGTRFALPPNIFESAPSGLGQETYTSAIPIPKEFALGEAWFKVSATYSCNIVHRLFWPIPSNPQDVRFVVR